MNTDCGKVRDVGIDAMRIVAIFGVIFNHSNERGFWLYSTCRPGSLPFWVYLFVSVTCKTVPLFLMITGAVMLPKVQESLGLLWKKRILRMSLALTVALLIYHLKELYAGGGQFQLRSFLNIVYSSGYWHLWYLYAYLAFLICLPFLQSMVTGLDDKMFWYMIAVSLFFDGVLPIFESFVMGGSVINSWLRPSWLLTYTVIYPCIGYFLYNRINIAEFVRGGILS